MRICSGGELHCFDSILYSREPARSPCVIARVDSP